MEQIATAAQSGTSIGASLQGGVLIYTRYEVQYKQRTAKSLAGVKNAPHPCQPMFPPKRFDTFPPS